MNEVTDTGLKRASSDWTPVPWLAAVLSLLITPLGLLYVQRPRLAAGYLGVVVAAAITSALSMWAFGSEPLSELLSVVPLVIAITCAVHSFRLARRQLPTSQRAWYSRWYGLVGIPAALFAIVFAVRAFLYEPFRIPSASMHPTIPAGSLVIIRKFGFGQYGTFGIQLWRRPATVSIARGDIVVHRSPSDPSVMHIRRVVGVPGDHVQYRDRQLVINEQPVPVRIVRDEGEYRYAIETLDGREITVAFMPGRPFKEFDQVLPPGEYALFGDSRDNARDSRFGGLTRQDDIVGRVENVFPARTSRSP